MPVSLRINSRLIAQVGSKLAGGPTLVSRLIPLLKMLYTGVGNELSLRATIRGYEGPIYKREAFISNPAPILFPNVDFGFIVSVVVSIIAMLFTYDIIAGEKRAGTLSLIMANDIPRGQLLLGKRLGSYLIDEFTELLRTYPNMITMAL